MRSPSVRALIVDNFAGGGGASLGLEWALGRSPDIAINHDEEAIRMHAANHPNTHHVCGDVWDVDPVGLCAGREVAVAWFSPDCKHFSKAKGSKPVEQGIRGLAWVVIRWARRVKPRVIFLENVEEFQKWGPLLEDGRPDPVRQGWTFRRWWGELEAAGYKVEMRGLKACDYGAPTSRKRLFIIARRDGRPIVWPEPSHGPGRAEPYRTAADCIDWSLTCPSIFDRKKPLVENTLRRIAHGMQRFVLESGEPFLIPNTHGGDLRVHGLREPMRTITAAHRGEFSFVAPTLVQTGYGERVGQTPRALNIQRPLGTIVAQGVKHALVTAFLAKHYGGHMSPGASLGMPISTITTQDHHALVGVSMQSGGMQPERVAAFLHRYNGNGIGQSMHDPLGTVTTRDRYGLVMVSGTAYAIVDIGQRMLVPRELFRGQGFPDTYLIDIGGLSKTAKVRMAGNSVSPYAGAAIVRANVSPAEVLAA